MVLTIVKDGLDGGLLWQVVSKYSQVVFAPSSTVHQGSVCDSQNPFLGHPDLSGLSGQATMEDVRRSAEQPASPFQAGQYRALATCVLVPIYGT